jgi:hypothetical protein
MQRLRSALATLGIAAAPHDPPRRLGERVTARFGEAGAPLVALLERLERQRYGREAIARPPPGFLREFVTVSVRLRAAAPR